MAAKWVKELKDLRKLGNETKETWEQRVTVATAVLDFIEEHPDCPLLRLYQNKGLEELSRTPDLTVECQHAFLGVIEIGQLGTERKEEIEGAGYPLIHVRRGSAFNFEAHWGACDQCPYSED